MIETTGPHSEHIDIIPFLDHVYLPLDEVLEFVRKCKAKGVNPHEYLAIALRQEIENANQNPDLLL